MENIKYYELTPAQEVVTLQCKYTLFKRVVNILSSMSTEEKLNYEIIKKAINLIIDRNDCLRLRFVKQNKELVQYFAPSAKIENLPIYEFKTEKEQLAFINKLSKKAIKYKKGIVFEPYFIKTYDNKYMIFLKVCHLILDVHGINIIFKDLFEVYNALLNQKELPPAPPSFETLMIKDLEKKHNVELKQKRQEFFSNYLKDTEEPYYVGLHGSEQKLWKKQQAKNKRTMKLFFINNDTKGYQHEIDINITNKLIEFSKQTGISLANTLFYACSLTASKLNNNAKNMMPIELVNMRGTAQEKKCAGTKAQSISCYTSINDNLSFLENLTTFASNQNTLYRYVGYSDSEFQKLMHTTYNSSFIETYYSIAFSFIPYSKPDNLDFRIYSNGKCALPAYLALLYNMDNGKIDIAYDVQTKIITEEDVKNYHQKLLIVLNQILDNPNINIKDIKI